MSEERAGQDPGETDDLDILDDELGIEPEEAPQPEGGAEPSPEPEPSTEATSPTRDHRRIQALRESRRRAEEEARQLREEVQRLRTQAPLPQQADPYRAAEEARREAEQVALMAPHEVAAYYAQKSERAMQAQLARQSVETSDRIDRMMWGQIKGSEAAARRLDSQVENYLMQARSQGMNPTREAIYNLLVGQEYRGKAGREIERQRRGAARRVAAQTTQPGTPRSGVPPQQRPRDDSDEALIQRLKSVTVGQAWE